MKLQRLVRLFLSHASEDKDDFVRPLATKLREQFEVWYDENSLIVGRSLLRQISDALSQVDYGVVVLSKNFFAKRWPQEELDGLFTLETAERKLILPIWHNVTEAEVKGYSAIIAARFASNSKKGIDGVVEDLVNAVTNGERARELSNPLYQKISRASTTAALNRKFEQLGGSPEGVNLVWNELSKLFEIIRNQFASPLGPLHLQIEESKYEPKNQIRVYGPRRPDDGYPLVLCLELTKMYANTVTSAVLGYKVYFEIFDWPNFFKGYDLVHEGEAKPYFDQDDQVVWRNAALDIIKTEKLAENAMSEYIDRVQDVLDGRSITYTRISRVGGSA